MSKKNEELARRIIEQHGNITEMEDQKPIMESNKDGDLVDSKNRVWSTDLAILGMGLGGIGKTKKEATESIIKQLADELDSGALSLSDTWAEDNLENVKDLTDSSEKQ